MFFENGLQGLSLIFAIDRYIKLSPILEQSFQFSGNCPFTGQADDVVVNELWETIKFGQLGLEISGPQLMKKLDQLYRDHGVEPDWRFNTIRTALANENALYQINEQLKSLQKDIQEISEGIDVYICENRPYWLDFEACLQIDYYICPTHRLYHEESGNILCRQHFDIDHDDDDKYQILEFVDNSRASHSPLKFNFEQCYLFHDLYDHQLCELEDILQISDIYYSLIPEYQFHRKLTSSPC